MLGERTFKSIVAYQYILKNRLWNIHWIRKKNTNKENIPLYVNE